MMVWVLIVVLIGSMAFAEKTVQTSEQQRIAQIAQHLQLRKPLAAEKITKEQMDFCATFLEDLKSLRNIEFVEPIVTTDDYNDPRLQSYLGKCPKLRPNKRVAFEPRIWEYAKTLPEDQAEELGTVWYTTGDFRLYHVDIDNNPANGREYLFYGGGSYNPQKQIGSGYTDYRILDLNDCTIIGGQQVRESMDHATRVRTGSRNGVVLYKGISYLFEASLYRKERTYNFYLYQWSSEALGKMTRVCSFDEIAHTTKGGTQ